MENIISTKTIYEPDSAIFIDQDKTTINVKVKEQFVVKDWSGNEHPKENTFIRTIRVEPSDSFTEFLEQISLENVEQNTLKTNELIEEQNKQLEDKIKNDILKELSRKKLIQHTQEAEEKATFDITNFSDDILFKLKLQSFEIEKVKNSTNRELKASLRKSSSFMETVAYTVAIILDK